MKTTDTIVMIRAKAFTGERVREHSVSVDMASGCVRVWDSVAGHFTNCHTLSRSVQSKARKLAAEQTVTHGPESCPQAGC